MRVESHIEVIFGIEVVYIKFNRTEEYYTSVDGIVQLMKMFGKKGFINEEGTLFYNGIPIIYHVALDYEG